MPHFWLFTDISHEMVVNRNKYHFLARDGRLWIENIYTEWPVPRLSQKVVSLFFSGEWGSKSMSMNVIKYRFTVIVGHWFGTPLAREEQRHSFLGQIRNRTHGVNVLNPQSPITSEKMTFIPIDHHFVWMSVSGQKCGIYVDSSLHRLLFYLLVCDWVNVTTFVEWKGWRQCLVSCTMTTRSSADRTGCTALPLHRRVWCPGSLRRNTSENGT